MIHVWLYQQAAFDWQIILSRVKALCTSIKQRKQYNNNAIHYTSDEYADEEDRKQRAADIEDGKKSHKENQNKHCLAVFMMILWYILHSCVGFATSELLGIDNWVGFALFFFMDITLHLMSILKPHDFEGDSKTASAASSQDENGGQNMSP